jgi:predicted small lipoprotein YifL
MARTHRLAPALLAVLAVSLAACGGRPPAPDSEEAPAADGYASEEAARTTRMEEEAEAIRDRWAEVQEMEGTPEEKQRAVEELMARERALMRDGEGEAPAADEEGPED